MTASEFSCTKCGAKYGSDAWESLVLSHRIEGAELHQNVVGWPDDVCIEVRICRTCAVPFAKKCARARAMSSHA
jgi:hypothetical protein